MRKGDLKLCNCAGCTCELLGESMLAWYESLCEKQREGLPPVVAGRIHGRPYCPACLAPRRPAPAAD